MKKVLDTLRGKHSKITSKDSEKRPPKEPSIVDPDIPASTDLNRGATLINTNTSAASPSLKRLPNPLISTAEVPSFSARVTPDCALLTNYFEYRYYLQPYTPGQKIDSCSINNNHLTEQFNINTDISEVLVYLPICLNEELYSDPQQFHDLLLSIVTIFKPRPVHIALALPDELGRHQIYKDKFMHADSTLFKPTRNSSSINLDKADDCREDAKKEGDMWIASHPIENFASQLGCKISLFRWGELVETDMTSSKLRTLFIEKMRIIPKQNGINADINICNLIDYVTQQHNSGKGFAIAVRRKLNEVSNKDIDKYSFNTDLTVSDRTSRKYLNEEVAHTMQVFATGIFDVTVQAQIFHRRKFSHKPGISLFGETLYHWSCELLNTYLSTSTGNNYISESPRDLNLPHYLTVGRYPTPPAKNRVVKPTSTKDIPTTSKPLSSPQKPRSLHEYVLDEVEARGGLKSLSPSEQYLYERALEFTVRKRNSSKLPKDNSENDATTSQHQSKSGNILSKDVDQEESLHASKSLTVTEFVDDKAPPFPDHSKIFQPSPIRAKGAQPQTLSLPRKKMSAPQSLSDEKGNEKKQFYETRARSISMHEGRRNSIDGYPAGFFNRRRSCHISLRISGEEDSRKSSPELMA